MQLFFLRRHRARLRHHRGRTSGIPPPYVPGMNWLAFPPARFIEYNLFWD